MLMVMNVGPILWTLALVWPIKRFIYEMSLQMSLFYKWNGFLLCLIGILSVKDNWIEREW